MIGIKCDGCNKMHATNLLTCDTPTRYPMIGFRSTEASLIW